VQTGNPLVPIDQEIFVEETEFNQIVDDTLLAIEEAVENCEADLDWDLTGGILTIECANGTQIIINRQTPTRQIWVAARRGGFHFDFNVDDQNWYQGEQELYALLNQALSEQCGEAVSLR
jgi:CyaY protein